MALVVCSSSVAVPDFVEGAKQGYATSIVQSLSDEVGPRLSGSSGAARAVEWALDAMKKAGLRNVHKEPVKTPKWTRGEESAQVVAPYVQQLRITALGGSVGTTDLQGEIAEVADLDGLKALGKRAAGKIVFVNKPWVGYGAASSIRWHAASEAGKLGARATLIRSAGSGFHRLPHTGGMAYDAGVKQIPAAALAAEDAELLHRLGAGGKPVVVRMSLGARDEGMVDSFNVVGEVPGREKADEIVLVGAHLDSWDLGTGALDDGAGCGIVIDTGRMLAARPPRRTVRVILFMNEEFGLSGAKAYAATHATEMSLHVAALEADSGTGKPDAFAAVGDAALLGQWVKPFFNLPVITGDHGGADLIPLASAGVPVVNVNQEGAGYFDWHHTAADTFDKIDPSALAQTTAATAYLAWMAAESLQTLPRATRAD